MQLPSWAFCLPSLFLSLTRLSSLKWQRHRQLMLPNVCWPRVGPCGRQGLLYGAAGPHLRSLAINYRAGAVQNRDPLPSDWLSSHLCPSQTVKELHTSTHTPIHLSMTTCLLEGTSKLTLSFLQSQQYTILIQRFRFCRQPCLEWTLWRNCQLYPTICHGRFVERTCYDTILKTNQLGMFVKCFLITGANNGTVALCCLK